MKGIKCFIFLDDKEHRKELKENGEITVYKGDEEITIVLAED